MGIDLTAWLDRKDYPSLVRQAAADMTIIIHSANQEFIQSNSFLRLKQLEERGELRPNAEFQYAIHPNDEYVAREHHEQGTAYVYPSKKAREYVEQLAREMGYTIYWNNTASICWISLKFE